MSVSKYNEAQSVLNIHREDVEKYFPD